MRRIPTALAAVTLLAGLAVIPATSALAAPTLTPCPSSTNPAPGQGAPGSPNPGGNSGDCPVTGTITIGAVFAIADDFSSFTVASTAPGSPSYIGDIYVEANNQSAGYSVTQTLHNGVFTSGSNTIPSTAVSVGTYEATPGTYQQSSTYAPLLGDNATGGQADFNFFASQIPGNPPSGTLFTGVTGSTSFNCQTPVGGWDCYGVAQPYLNTTAQFAPGTYTGTVNYDLWIN